MAPRGSHRSGQNPWGHPQLFSHSAHANYLQILLTYCSNYFQNPLSSSTAVSDVSPCLAVIYSSVVKAFLLKHESSDPSPVLTSHFTQSWSKSYKGLKAPAGLVPSTRVRLHVLPLHHFLWAFLLFLQYLRLAHTSGRCHLWGVHVALCPHLL